MTNSKSLFEFFNVCFGIDFSLPVVYVLWSFLFWDVSSLYINIYSLTHNENIFSPFLEHSFIFLLHAESSHLGVKNATLVLEYTTIVKKGWMCSKPIRIIIIIESGWWAYEGLLYFSSFLYMFEMFIVKILKRVFLGLWRSWARGFLWSPCGQDSLLCSFLLALCRCCGDPYLKWSCP